MTVINIKRNYTASKPKTSFYDDAGQLCAVSVAHFADSYGISERRVRQMLDKGILKGSKLGRAWRIDFPINMQLGTRGPVSSVFKQMSTTPKKRRKRIPHTNPKFKKGD